MIMMKHRGGGTDRYSSVKSMQRRKCATLSLSVLSPIKPLEGGLIYSNGGGLRG